MLTGVIASFSQERGFGFIRPDEAGPDGFVHLRGLGHGVPSEALAVGTPVTYLTETAEKGIRACSVQIVRPDGGEPEMEKLIRVAAAAFDDLIVAARGRGWEV